VAPIPTHLRGRTAEPAWSTPADQNLDLSWQWREAIVCDKQHRHLRLNYYGDLSRYNQICDRDEGRQIIYLECTACDDKFIGFDADIHGHDAGLGYVDKSEADRTITSVYGCKCGNTIFDFVAGVYYHSEDDESSPEEDIGNLFESISIAVKCISCGEQFYAVEYETA